MVRWLIRRQPWTSRRAHYVPSPFASTNFYTTFFIEPQKGSGGKGPLKHTWSNPLPQAGTSSTRSGCSEPPPAWPGMFPQMGHQPPLWATCASASPPSLQKPSSLYPVQISPLSVLNHYTLSCFGRRVGLDDPQRSLPTPTVL